MDKQKKEYAETKIPNELFGNITYEECNAILPDGKLGQIFENLFFAEQHFDWFTGWRYAQENFLSKDIKLFNTKSLEIFILKLHEYMAKNVLFLNGTGSISGQYISRRVFKGKMSKIPNVNYEVYKPWVFSTKNYNILKNTVGQQSANNYKKFCENLKGKYNQKLSDVAQLTEETFGKASPEQIYKADKLIDIIDLIHEYQLEQYPGYQTFLKTTYFSPSPADVIKKMPEFCKVLCQMIGNNETPEKISSAALSMINIHPFLEGNVLVSRMLANCILMSFGKKPINFKKFKKEFDPLVESNDMNALEGLIKKHSGKMSIDNENHIIINEINSFMATDLNVTFIQHKDHIDLIKSENTGKYMKVLQLVSSKNALTTIMKKSSDQMILAFQNKNNEELEAQIKKQARIQLTSCIQLKIDALWFTKIKVEDYALGIYCSIKAANYYYANKEVTRAASLDLNSARRLFNKKKYEEALHFIKRIHLLACDLSRMEQESVKELSEKLLFVENVELQSNFLAKNEKIETPSTSLCDQGIFQVKKTSESKKNADYVTLLNEAKDYIKRNLEEGVDRQSLIDSLENKKFGVALRQVCSNGYVPLASMLLNHIQAYEIDCLNNASRNGNTALHWSADYANKTSKLAILELVLKSSIDKSLKNDDGHDYLSMLNENIKEQLCPSETYDNT